MKVLIADDEAVGRRLLERSLRNWGYEPVVARDGDEALQILLEPDAPKLAVLDWLMPGIDGAQICQDIRLQKPAPYTYIVLLSSRRERADVVAGLKAGADDYVIKPFEPAELEVRLRTGERIIYLQDQLIGALDTLRDQSSHDMLTGLWNRASILEALDREIGRAQREDTALGLILLDLDFFKAINDTYGHATGDQVLRCAARTMRDRTRSYDAVGRYGGEEFLVVLPGCDRGKAVRHAGRLRAAIASATVSATETDVQFTASLGVAAWNSGMSTDPCDLIQAADAALYRAKKLGRNRAEAARPGDYVCMSLLEPAGVL